jgi:hypothetical protein
LTGGPRGDSADEDIVDCGNEVFFSPTSETKQIKARRKKRNKRQEAGGSVRQPKPTIKH